ncbi:hypothetical protein [Paracoccus aestuariivivens]|uniref:Uncharacterized protein n=1 Tax=Paracoccus aestuariivivens TaxID=1820333 RepID=A0A6L6JBE7_9RHOB|nr:hypothetical protein [Paracoccus aestuariivivens]MTH77979.1 hypothetical protein [Paracoccus aestuariivivens]
MTSDELIAALAPSRLPETMLMPGWGELLALFGIGLLAGSVLAAIVSPLMARRQSRRALIRATRGLPAQERLLRIGRILGHLPPALRRAAYDAALAPNDAEIERALRRGRRRR